MDSYLKIYDQRLLEEEPEDLDDEDYIVPIHTKFNDDTAK